MINLLLGAPGGGKSYEAVVFHILPAIVKGRKVITNLPVNLVEFEKIVPGASELLEVRTATKAPRPAEHLETEQDSQRVRFASTPWRPIPFWHSDDFSDTWRHPDAGYGPLYVIDECHIPLPVRGTLIQVEEWFSLHRHHNADVLLITQSYGKINAAIRDLVQVVYRVRKNVALGSMGSYTRKVQDGLRGEVVNTTIRKYESKFFALYKSHTQSNSGSELGANDIRPFWKHWTFIGAGIFFALFLALLSTGKVKGPFGASEVKPSKPVHVVASVPVPAHAPDALPSVRPVSYQPPPTVQPSPQASQVLAEKPEPFGGMTLHIKGSIIMGKQSRWYFVAASNGVPVTDVDSERLEHAGYTWTPIDHCLGWLDYPGLPRRALRCDVPAVALKVGNA